MLNTKSEYRNPKQIRNSNVSMFKTKNEGATSKFPGFDHLDFGNSDLPFDLAQGGELVEPFRAPGFGFRI